MNSIRVRLLLWVLIPFSVALVLFAILSFFNSIKQVKTEQDNLLWSAAHIISDATYSTGKTIVSDAPLSAFEIFSIQGNEIVQVSVRSNHRVFYGVANLPTVKTADNTDGFGIISFQGSQLRAFTLHRNFQLADGIEKVTITVAKAQGNIDSLAWQQWFPNVWYQMILWLLLLFLLLYRLRAELRPLQRLEKLVHNREKDDLQQIDTTVFPSELQPALQTINQYAQRVEQQIHSRRRLIDDAAHQMRTPLAVLATQLHYVCTTDDEHERKAALKQLNAQVQRLKSLINQLLILSQTENYRSETVSHEVITLPPLLNEILVELAPLAASRSIQIEVLQPLSQSPIKVPRVVMHPMIYNVLDNAIRYTPEGGVVTVSIQNDVSTHQVCLTVLDTGPGIPEEYQEQVFERFCRLDQTQEGSGLGLAIVKQGLLGCGGQIHIENRITGGLALSLGLPIAL